MPGNHEPSIENLLARVDDEGFERLCTRLRILFGRGLPNQAVNAVLEFWDEMQEQPETLTRETSIYRVGLPARVSTWLDGRGIYTLGELEEKSESELLSYKEIGPGSIGEIRDVLERMRANDTTECGHDGC